MGCQLSSVLLCHLHMDVPDCYGLLAEALAGMLHKLHTGSQMHDAIMQNLRIG